MMSEKGPVDDPTAAGNGRITVDLALPGRRRFCGALARRLFCAALVCLLFAGCSTIGKPSHHSMSRSPILGRASKPNKEKREPLFGSWFRPKEPSPPQSLDDWMKLEPIRP